MTTHISGIYIVRIARNLREFGYQVTDLEVEERVRQIEKGEDSKADIIARFARNMLQEAGLIEAQA